MSVFLRRLSCRFKSQFTGSGGVWSISKQDIAGYPGKATINATTGVITGVAGGLVQDKYTSSNGCSDEADVIVFVKPTINVYLVTLCIYGTSVLTADPPGGTWQTSDEWIATVDATGKVTGRRAGTAKIKYFAMGACPTR